MLPPTQHNDPGNRSAEPVFLAEKIHAVLHADTAVALAECGGGETHVTDAAVGCGCGKADEIQGSTTADDEDVAVAVQRRVIDGLPALLHEVEVIFAGLSAGQNVRFTGKIQHLGMGPSIGFTASARPGRCPEVR